MNSETKGATAVYLNGNIYTVDRDFSCVEALAVKNDRLLYVGADAVAKRFITPDTEVVNLGGKTVLPGLLEGHTHFGWLSNSLLEVRGLGRQKEEILKEVAERARTAKAGEWIIGRGWNNEIWGDKSFPTKEELDRVSPRNPVCMYRICCHAYWANSEALRLAGITGDSQAPLGGEIVRGADGEPAGVLIDNAGDRLTEIIPPYSKAYRLEALKKGEEHLLSYGFTGVMDAGANLDEIEAMRSLCQSGELSLRLYIYAAEGEAAEHVYKKGAEIGLYDEHFTLRGVKLFGDGSLGARSAHLLEDYADTPGHRGLARYSDEVLHKAVRDARLNGFQVSVHAIGDSTLQQVLRVYKSVLDELPLRNNRYRIEHCAVAREEDIRAMVAYGFIPSMQAVHCTSDWPMIGKCFGEASERAARTYVWRDFLNAGLHIANGSDAPVEEVNPYCGFYAAVTRKDRGGKPAGGWYPKQCMRREEALRAATVWVAEAQFEEHLKGSLEVGKLADFIVTDRDYMNCPVEEIKDMQTLITVIGGKKVYEKA
ncbi:MAG: amidohydrolase [Clostridiales Family XIII bacterium]|jgi:predicted amidohydrolase YtcJ|nr:amidohydrolase [Clostridiales Family XIII bacterium]